MSGDYKVGKVLNEGKTKIIHELPGTAHVLIESKDRITANNAAKVNELEGKAAISTSTTCKIFEILEAAGVKTHLIARHGDKGIIAESCDMIPIEWVTRRVATGSFLRRNPGVKEGYRFCPPKLETFFKDDANDDPQWSNEQLIEAKLEIGGQLIGQHEVDLMGRMTVCIFEILEKIWSKLECSLIDMKIEFGVSKKTGEIVLADVIDSDSWRLWPSGDKRLMKDKQVYRNLEVVTPEALDTVKRNFQWVADRLETLPSKPGCRAVIFMGSPSDMDYCQKIEKQLTKLGVPSELRICSAHKETSETLRLLAQYEGAGIPTVFIAVAGRSNGLGPVLAGNSSWPVINAPPLTSDWAAEDIWSSLRLPSGLGCGTVITPDAAATAAAQILALNDCLIWSKIRAKQLQTWLSLKESDRELMKKISAENGANGAVH
ncbi:multifunctional protein ADE2-like [Tubulanus polymorphus]|uniref:multifunctional protein ADE2-like n=1 Tax=Tubulanus polymorphus TaxID=672921 RepID=UPI003DA5DB6B